jgi:uncharacterized membrane protein YdbT with pleckstrin-like domain
VSYIRKTLGIGEEILFTAKFHWTYTLIALLWLAILGVILIGIWMSVLMIVQKWTTEITVTNRRFVFKTGWISRKTEEVSLNRIEKIRLQQSVLGRILGYGRITVYGTGIGEIEVPTIKKPLELRRQITNAKDIMKNVAPAPEAVPMANYSATFET